MVTDGHHGNKDKLQTARMMQRIKAAVYENLMNVLNMVTMIYQIQIWQTDSHFHLMVYQTWKLLTCPTLKEFADDNLLLWPKMVMHDFEWVENIA